LSFDIAKDRLQELEDTFNRKGRFNQAEYKEWKELTKRIKREM